VTARFFSWVLGLTGIVAVYALPALAEAKRVALVIGNSAYRHSAELRNPRNDALNVADALRLLDFTVILGFDLDQSEMRRTISRFAHALEDAGVGVFYYAGHGIQLNGTNYLVPTDSKLENQYSPEFELIPVGMVQRVMENKRRTNILFLDACRDNPLARNLARAMGTRSSSLQRGLSSTESGIGTLVSFSTQPGNVAVDGQGRNSPYAAALALQLKQPGVALSEMLINVRRDVMRATDDKQIPWEHSALRDRFYFATPKPVVVAPPPPPAAKPDEEPAELTPAQKARLSTRLHRELRRVGCDPRATGGTWTATSQDALQRFADITKLALYTDVPTQAALDAVVSRKFIVCPRLPVTAVPRAPAIPAQTPIATTTAPTVVTPPAVFDPAAAAPPPPAVPPPRFVAPPATIDPAAATPPTAVALPIAPVPPVEVSPPAAAKPPKPAPRAIPRAAAVKSSPPPPKAQEAPTAPFTTSIQREKPCRVETWQECANRIGNPTGITSICPPAARKEICPGSRPAAARPPPARTVGREKKCGFEESAFTQRPPPKICD
jgi:uncharacterized caspase-like protein